MIWREIPYWRLSGFYFFYFAVVGTLSPFFGLYLQHLQFTPAEIGSLTAVLMVTRVIAPNVWGWLSDITGRRLMVIRTGAVLACLAFGGIFWQQSFWSVAAVVALFSFFWNAVLAQFEVITLNHLHGHTHFYSRIRLWGSVGFIVAVLGLGWLFERAGMGLFPLMMWLFLALIWLMTLLVYQPAAVDNSREVRQPFSRYLWRWPVVSFLASGMLLQFSFGSFYTFYSVYLEALGYPRFTIGSLWALGVLAEIVFFLLVHRVLQRFGLRRVMIFALAVTALRWWLTGCYADLLWLLVVTQLLHAFSFGAVHAVSIEWVRRFFPGRVQGQGQALYSALCFGAGGGLGALASGAVWEQSPVLAFAISAVAAAGALLWVWLGIRQEPQEPAAEPIAQPQ